jgi:hypothetical protein
MNETKRRVKIQMHLITVNQLFQTTVAMTQQSFTVFSQDPSQ